MSKFIKSNSCCFGQAARQRFWLRVSVNDQNSLFIKPPGTVTEPRLMVERWAPTAASFIILLYLQIYPILTFWEVSMKRRRFNNYELDTGCGVEACLELIGGKWKGVILHHLLTEHTLRFSELQKLKPSLSSRILTAQLRELESDGLIVRKVYAIVPPKVEYSLSPIGRSLIPLIKAMQRWGDKYLLHIKADTRPRSSQ